jgi:hypothetical protein
MVLDVVRRCPQDHRIVPELAEAEVAPLAQQRPHPSGVMIMIQVLRSRVAADGAAIVLGRPQPIDLRLGDPVLPAPVCVAAGPPIACPAHAAEPRPLTAVQREVLVGHRLSAGGTPSEAIRYPGVVPDRLALRSPGLPVPSAAPTAVAREAVERESVGQRPVAPEGTQRLFLTARWADLHFSYSP